MGSLASARVLVMLQVHVVGCKGSNEGTVCDIINVGWRVARAARPRLPDRK